MHPFEIPRRLSLPAKGRLVLILLAAIAGLPAPAQTAAALFDANALQDVYLEVDSKDWQTLRDNYLLDTYYPAKFAWRGLRLERVAIRSRGSGSRSPEKPNLLISFNRYDSGQRFLGLASVVAKANNQDASLLREILAMQLYRQMGIPAPLEAPARLFVNGEFFGAYTLVENMDEAFLMRNFGEDSGYLYDWQENRTDGYRFEYLGPDPALYVPAMWDPKTRKSDPDAAAVVSMVRAINESSDAEFVEAVSRYIDLKQFMTYIAAENFLADFDGLLGRVFGMNNFYFYRFAGDTQGVFLPWDKDGAFDWYGQDIFAGVNENVLARRALEAPELRRTYLAALVKAASLAGGPGGAMEQELDRLYALVHEIAHADPHKQCAQSGVLVSCGPGEFEQGVEAVRQFIRARAEVVLREAVAAGYSFSAKGPRLLPGGVVNAASNAGGLLAPGSLVSLYGDGLAAGEFHSSALPAPTKLAGVVVSVNGARARLLFVSPGQINAQLPWSLSPGPLAITVSLNGEPGNTVIGQAGAHAPGVFVVAHTDGTLVNAASPAKPGEAVVIYATGLGYALEAAEDWRTSELPEVRFGEAAADVEWSRLLPESYGVYQVRVRVPSNVPLGDSVALVLSIGGQATSTSVALAAASSIY